MSSVRSGRSVDAALRKKGFSRSVDSDHLVYRLFGSNGELFVRTKISHGMLGSSLSADLISKMARQLHLTKNEFLALVDCPMNEEQYREILGEKGFIVR